MKKIKNCFSLQTEHDTHIDVFFNNSGNISIQEGEDLIYFEPELADEVCEYIKKVVKYIKTQESGEK